MHVSVTLRGRARVAALLPRLEQKVDQQKDGPRLDRRNRRTWRQLILGVVVMRSTRLLALGRMVAPQRRARSVKAAAQGLAYFLKEAQVPVGPLSTRLLEEAVRQIDPDRVVQYKGKALLVLDPTEDEKRSRGRGKCGRHMHYSGRVRRSKTTRPAKSTKNSTKRAASPSQQHSGAQPTDTPARVATTSGYVDSWAGLALTGKPFFPLARRLFSSQHPACTSQHAVEEAVLTQALGVRRRVGLEAIAIGDRGVGRKEVIIRLAKQEQDAVLRVDPDITVRSIPPTRPTACSSLTH